VLAGDGSVSVAEALEQLSRNEKRLSDFTKLAEAMRQLAITKIPHVQEIVESFESANLPVIVFSSYVDPVHAIGARDGWLFVSGQKMSKGFKTRNDIVKAFQDPNSEWTDSHGVKHKGYRGIACTTNAMGMGHTLTRAENAIFVNRTWVPGMDAQAEDRINRIGSTGDSTNYIDVICNHDLDRRLYAAITKKRELIEKTTRKIPMHTKSLDPGIERKIREHKALIKQIKKATAA
jgi:hypothetical protein